MQRTKDNLSEEIKVLLAEDNRVNQHIIVLLLKKLGYSADVVDNGAEVLQALEREPYHVILMDLQMPEMDGISASQHIHQLYSPSQWPYIIALTASVTEGDRQKCSAAGMQDYLTKPVQSEALKNGLDKAKQAIQQKLEIKETANISALREAPCSGVNEPLHSPRQTPAINMAVIQSIRDMAGATASQFISELVDEFLEDTPTRIEAISKAMNTDDPETLYKEAHGLRSSSASLGAEKLSALCQFLEQEGRAGNIPHPKEYCSSLQVEYDVAKSELLALKRD